MQHHIFVVDDNIGDRLLLEHQISEAGLNITLQSARDGEEAIDALNECITQQTIPDVVFLDINMPRIDGFQVLQHIRTHNELADIPVLMLSGSYSPNDIEKAKKQHANGYVVKGSSFSMDDILLCSRNNTERWLQIGGAPL